MPSSLLSKLNLTVVAGFERALAGNRNSVSSLLGQGRLFCQNLAITCSSRSIKASSMAASNSMPVFGDVYVDDIITSCGNLDLAKPSGVCFNGRNNRASCRGASLSLRRKDLCNGRLCSGNLFVNGKLKNLGSGSVVGPRLRSPCSSVLMCYSTAQDLSFDGSSQKEQDPIPAILCDRALRLVSGSCYLPHPEKEETGGEDDHFICEEEQAIGVADGVGGWAEVGINSGLFSRQLMSNSVAAIREEPKGSINPARVLEKAHLGTNAKGSSTACIIALTDKGLQAINLGDSGFIVVRDGCTFFQSPVQQHSFNLTYQLECGSGADLPRSGQVFTIPVVIGDVIVAGTDGLFDNLYNNEITAVVLDAVRAGLEPQAMAQKIAALARQRALDRTRQTPFATAAQEAGFRYYGGKLDDLTVVVSYVSSSSSA